MKVPRWFGDKILFIITLFLLAFIPLYPKLPLVDIKNTWVYIRAEDFIVALVVFLWVFLLVRKKVTLKTPLTLPILFFWIIGGIATIHGVLVLFPLLSDVYANVALLSFLRRIEYMFLFFVAYTSIKDKKSINYVIGTLVAVLLSVIAYGMGQKFLGFPAFLTMNEEFAKGIPIQLSALSRVPSTFAGHYDLAAYLVLIIPIITSLAFGFKNWFIKLFFLGSAGLGFILLFMTVSRVSFFVLLLSLVLLLIFQRKKWIIVSLMILTLLSLSFSPRLLQRFGSSLTEVDVLVDATTGAAIKQVKEVPADYFANKTVLRGNPPKGETSATSSAVLPFVLIPKQATLVIDPTAPNGESLPQGTGYVNLPLSPVTKRVDIYFYEKSNPGGSLSGEVRAYFGEFLVKRAIAYDLSFTTRFQGEWPRTFAAFQRNIFLGNGYGSVSLAVDNNFLRILGESGLLGFAGFMSIFLIAGIYIKKTLPKVESPLVRSFVVGFVAGSFGLILNATLIDVFEASKIAFTYWILMGITLGLLHFYQDEKIDVKNELRRIIFSDLAIIGYLFVLTITLFFSSTNSFFTGDDFTWFRWVADCSVRMSCGSTIQTITSYFTDSQGFFYRPGTKLFFLGMYSTFWLNQTVYHFVSILLHFLNAALLFILLKKTTKNSSLSGFSAGLFLVFSGHSEAIFWISSIGFLFNALFAFCSILFFMYWREKKKLIYFVLSLLAIVGSLLFHEVGVIVPLLIILYDVVFGDKSTSRMSSIKTTYLLLLSPLLPYMIMRFIAHSHWLSGDYSYNLLKLPFNIIGNTIGYILLAVLGPASLAIYDGLRNFSRGHLVLSVIVSLILISLIVVFYKKVIKQFSKEEQKIIIFGFTFFMIALLPFLGLGNITSRYMYLSLAGFAVFPVLIVKKIYVYLVSAYDKTITLSCIAIVVMIFSMIHLFQLQKIQTDWRVAGEKSKTFLISLDQFYKDEWKTRDMQFYFVNVPIRNGDAWVFPVGLNDAVWFSLRNNRIGVYQVGTLEQAYGFVEDSRREKIYEFNSVTGAIVEKEKPRMINGAYEKQ